MTRRAAVAVALALVALLGPMPARAGTASGACLMTMSFTFPSNVTNNTAPMPLQDFSAHGTCATDAQPLSPLKTIDMGGADPVPGLFTRCDLMEVDGFFTVNWLPDPAPAANNGVFNFYGNALGGIIKMTGTTPTLVAVGVLVGIGNTGCLTGGTRTLTYTAVLTFIDP